MSNGWSSILAESNYIHPVLIDMQIVSFIGLKWSANSFVPLQKLRLQLNEQIIMAHNLMIAKKIDGDEEVAFVW